MTRLSQTVKNFITQFEYEVLPHINRGDKNRGRFQSLTCYVSSETLRDPQLKELLGITPGQKHGKFMGVQIIGKPDLTVEVHNEDK